MKRLLGMVLALVSMGFVVGAEAKAADVSHQNTSVNANATPAPQWQRDRYGRRYNRRYDRRWGRSRTVTRSRVVRYGRRLYRETYAITYLPSGRYSTRLISRSRIG
ncbi:MAG TPA: hypothetical protein VHH35_19335 [Pyrinomonadaceae bacterium]|nr:hypothetical protein [Pyrinomonadaceae bacterium]